MFRVSVVTLGCPKNLVDSEELLSRLRDEGISHTTDAGEADIILVNTCGFIEEAKRESIDEILKLKKIREKGARLLVFGCLAKRYGKELIAEIPEIDALFGVGEESAIIEYCKTAAANRRAYTPIGAESGSSLSRTRAMGTVPDLRTERCEVVESGLSPTNGNSYAYLKISEGCNRSCTYCVIPAIRGRHRSTPPGDIVKRAEGLVRSGVRELILVAQDSGSYGRELKGYNLSSLLRDIASVEGNFRIRLMYLNPSSVNSELLSVIASEEKICKYLDIPLQHSGERVLKAMGRTGSAESYRRTIRKVREAIPDVALRTTFIVGFPGETDSDFRGLIDFVEEMRFERLGAFVYSREEGTPAAKMKGQVPRRIKLKRLDEMMRVQSHISLDKNKALRGRKFSVLVDEVDGNTAIARLCSQAPEIDGVVILNKSEIRNPKSEMKPGEFLRVKITEAYDYDLKAEVVE